MSNKLKLETSPYLLQHKNNPVQWLAWNYQSLYLAKKQKKPILLSIGYSACHWCHVMAHESFEDKEIASIMNKYFINIKVDKEERPDLDSYYQSALTLMGERGGWPLTMFLDASTKPFWGGTYFPKNSRYGLPGFKNILLKINKTYSNSKQTVIKKSKILDDGINKSGLFSETVSPPNMRSNLSNNVDSAHLNTPIYSNSSLRVIFKIINNNMDLTYGGLIGDMKFPQVPLIKTLGAAPKVFALNDSVVKTLLSLSLGGIYDHVGGGIARYTVDDKWLVPHFEKMLYDNALFIELLAIHSNNVRFRYYFQHKINHSLAWLTKTMRLKSNKNCCFYSAIDADSEGVEGKYYIWNYEEIKRILVEETNYFISEYNIKKNGNWNGKNILNRLEKSNQNEITNEYSDRNIKLLKKIKSIRDTRIPPQIDTKIISDWNLMLCSALIRAYRSYQNEIYYKIAKQILSYFEEKIKTHKILFHSYCNDGLGHTAFLSDYANLIKVYINFYLCNFNKCFLDKAINNTKYVIEKFYNSKKRAFYYSPTNIKNINNTTNMFDTATQSGAGIMFENLISLHNFTYNNKYLKIVNECISFAWPSVYKNPISLSSFIHAANLIINSHHIVIIRNNDKKYSKIESYLRQHLIFNTFVSIKKSSELSKDSPVFGKKTINDQTTIYICSKSACYEPINDIEKLKKKLQELPFL